MVRRSSTFVAGLETFKTTNGAQTVKNKQVQRYTKNKTRGLRASEFLKSQAENVFSMVPVSERNEELWTIPALQKNLQEEMNDHKTILSWCLDVLSTSPAAATMMKEAAQEGWKIGISSQSGHDFHLDVPEKKIILDDCGVSPSAMGSSEYFCNTVLVSLIRALRDVWQEKRHGGFDENYDPESILMLERVRAADCSAVAVLVSWELRSEGQSGLWRHLIGSEEGDMAMAFTGHLEQDPSSIFTGAALIAAFNQWYRNKTRVNACDHETLEYMDSVLRDNPGNNPFGNKKPTPIGVEILSCLPDRTAYLKTLGREILNAPLYAGLNDEVNQQHFMQVMHDTCAIYVQNVPFRDADLAEKIFPGGEFTPEEDHQEI